MKSYQKENIFQKSIDLYFFDDMMKINQIKTNPKKRKTNANEEVTKMRPEELKKALEEFVQLL